MKLNLKQLTALLYGIYAVGAVMQFSYTTLLEGSFALVMATVILYMKRKETAGTPYETHFTWLLRTFWIGGGVYLPVLSLIGTAFMYPKIDFDVLAQRMMEQGVPEALSSGDSAQIEAMGEKYMAVLNADYGHLLYMVTLAVSMPFIAWWLWRCWKGIAALRAGKPVDKVMSWV
jgi:uncharacterized membrane protein